MAWAAKPTEHHNQPVTLLGHYHNL